MTRADIATLLAMAAAYDQRTIGEADVQAWYAVIGSLDPVDARDAILDHYADSRDRIMPADVNHRVKAKRAARANIPIPAPPNPDDTREYQRQIQDAVRTAASGKALPRNELSAADPPQEILDRPDRRAQYLVVACPWCRATVGNACEGPDGKPLKKLPAHPSRVEAVEGKASA